jgi:hypothetical protein
MGNHHTKPESLDLLSYDGTVEGFNRVQNQLSDKEIKELGQQYNLWVLGCKYHFLRTNQVDVTTSAGDVISNFKQKDAIIYNKSDEEAIRDFITLNYATNSNTYTDRINELNNKLSNSSPYKNNVNMI